MDNVFDLREATVVVTGSTRGIGKAIARLLLMQGAAVVVNGLDPEETAHTLVELAALADDTAQRVSGLAGDIAEQVTADRLVEHAVATFGRLDHVICNAGIDMIKPALDYTPEEWDRIQRVNLRGAFLPAQAAARHWISQGRPGGITMTSSIAGQVGIPGLAPYAASKGGVNQLVRTLAAEWAVHSIRVNAVAPGYVDNIMTGVTAHSDPRSADRVANFTPLRRRASLIEIAAPFAFLASPAASYITGSILTVDGGYTAT